MAIFLALLSSALWGGADFKGGQLTKKFPPIAVAGASQAIGLLFGVILVIVSGDFTPPNLNWSGYFLNGVIAGILGYIGLLSLYAGLATGRMGVVSPVSSLCALVPLAYSLLRGDRLSALQGVAIAIACAGAFCASGPEFSQGISLRPLLLALCAALGFGVALIFMARGSQSQVLLTMLSMRATTFAFSTLMFLKFRNFGGLSRRQLAPLIFIGVADFSANLLLGFASTLGLLSIVMVLGSLFPLMVVFLAFVVLHERLYRIQYLGIFLALLGVAIISSQ